MSLRATVAAPFKQEGKARIGEHEFVVALSLDRDWLSPDQAKRVIDIATGEGLVSRDDGDLIADFDLDSVEIPEDFSPDDSVFRERSAFERAVEAVEADGHEKREVVAAVNELQRELGVTADAAAIVYARRHGVDVSDAGDAAREGL